MLAATVRRAILAATVVTVCTAPATATAAVTLPPANGPFDYQIGGAYTPAASVKIVDRDRTAAPVAGRYNVCYVNAFQTQSDEVAWWKANHDNLLLKRNGAYVVDSAWNEILLDTSTSAKRTELASIVGGWIDGCRDAGYQAVEPDNLDSWTRSKRRLTKADNTAYASLLISRAHAAGLAIAQKNTTELGTSGKAMGFDFAIAEECQAYSECGQYTGPYGNRVYEIEYTDNGGIANFNAACAARGASISVIYRDRDVVPKGRPGYVYKEC
jgi:hypothetical protein